MKIETAETTSSTESTPDAGGDDTVLAAVRDALGKPADGAGEPTAAATDQPADEPAAAQAPPSELTELQRIRDDIKAQQKEQRLREEARAAARKEYEATLASEKERITKEVREQLAADFKKRLRTSPVDALTEHEVDGAELVRQIAERAGPNGQQAAELAALREEIAALKGGGAVPKEVADALAEVKAWKDERAKDAAARAAQAAEQAQKHLVSIVTEKAPGAAAYYGDSKAVYARAQQIADEYCQAKGETTCPYAVIVSELESEARTGAADRVKALAAQLAALQTLQQPAAVTVPPTETNGRKQVPRTPSAAGASERRASPKPADEMTAAELDEAVLVAAREAMGPKKVSRMG
jgi:hypothetical protein